METQPSRSLVPRRLWPTAVLLALVPCLFDFLTRLLSSSPSRSAALSSAAAVLLREALRYTVALWVFVRLAVRGGGERPRGHLGGTVAGSLLSGLLLFLLSLPASDWLAPFGAPSRLLFELAEAAIVGWCLLAAQTAWEERWYTPAIGALLGAVISSISLAWMPLEGGFSMALLWGTRTLMTYGPLALLFHLVYRRQKAADKPNNRRCDVSCLP